MKKIKSLLMSNPTIAFLVRFILLRRNLIQYVKYIVIIFAIIYIYKKIFFAISDIKGAKIGLIDFIYILLISWILYFKDIKNNLIKYLFPAIPIIILFASFDTYQSFMLRSPRYSDLENLFLILQFDKTMFFIILFLVSLMASLLIILLILGYKNYTKKQILFDIFYKFCLIFLIIYISTSNFYSHYHKKYFEHLLWSDLATIRENGRISSFIFYSNMEKENIEILKKQNRSDTNISQELYPASIKNKKNIYIIVLESFINPLFLDKTYSKNPIADEIKPYLLNGEFSKIISPVYGGGTAQAEFEALTGIKALAKVNTIEFNVMRGGEINSFIKQLKQNGYTTYTTLGASDTFFNSKLAYRSIGLDSVNCLVKPSDKYILFDGDVLNNNFNEIRKIKANNNTKPLVNYILGMYGHMPYDDDLTKRPQIIHVYNNKNENIVKITNQFYYRTKALGNYLTKLIASDPNAIIYVTGDHIPSVLDKDTKYKYNKFTTIALLLVDGKPVNINGKKQYEMPWMIWDILSKKPINRKHDDKTLEKMYYKALYESTL